MLSLFSEDGPDHFMERETSSSAFKKWEVYYRPIGNVLVGGRGMAPFWISFLIPVYFQLGSIPMRFDFDLLQSIYKKRIPFSPALCVSVRGESRLLLLHSIPTKDSESQRCNNKIINFIFGANSFFSSFLFPPRFFGHKNENRGFPPSALAPSRSSLFASNIHFSLRWIIDI